MIVKTAGGRTSNYYKQDLSTGINNILVES